MVCHVANASNIFVFAMVLSVCQRQQLEFFANKKILSNLNLAYMQPLKLTYIQLHKRLVLLVLISTPQTVL